MQPLMTYEFTENTHENTFERLGAPFKEICISRMEPSAYLSLLSDFFRRRFEESEPLVRKALFFRKKTFNILWSQCNYTPMIPFAGKSSLCTKKKTKGRAHVFTLRSHMQKIITEVPRKEAYNLKEIAWLLSISVSKVRYEIDDGILSSINIGRRDLVTQQQLDNYLTLKSFQPCGRQLGLIGVGK